MVALEYFQFLILGYKDIELDTIERLNFQFLILGYRVTDEAVGRQVTQAILSIPHFRIHDLHYKKLQSAQKLTFNSSF